MNNNLSVKNFIWVIVVVSALAWIGLAIINGLDLSDVSVFLRQIPTIVTIDAGIYLLFAKWGWKIPWFQGWLVPFPNINGSWTGYIFSDWTNAETGEKIGPIPTMLTIKQSFSGISCVMHTKEMKSFSYAEGFHIEADRQIKQLAYVYTSKPSLTVSDRSSPHDGTALLDIIGKPRLKLKGRYWTERKTSGEIELEYKTSKLLEEIPPDLLLHPMTKEDRK
jgi:hypothetical protein